mgnify:CR=1 FL=1
MSRTLRIRTGPEPDQEPEQDFFLRFRWMPAIPKTLMTNAAGPSGQSISLELVCKLRASESGGGGKFLKFF